MIANQNHGLSLKQDAGHSCFLFLLDYFLYLLKDHLIFNTLILLFLLIY